VKKKDPDFFKALDGLLEGVGDVVQDEHITILRMIEAGKLRGKRITYRSACTLIQKLVDDGAIRYIGRRINQNGRSVNVWEMVKLSIISHKTN
jgi:hypothetical protein